MWIMLNDAFVSIVRRDCGPDELLVRARRAGDIQRVFGRVKVTRHPASDYLYRALVPKHLVMGRLAAEVDKIDYPNFKNAVGDRRLHDAYLKVWSAMAGVQPSSPYSGARSSLIVADDMDGE